MNSTVSHFEALVKPSVREKGVFRHSADFFYKEVRSNLRTEKFLNFLLFSIVFKTIAYCVSIIIW